MFKLQPIYKDTKYSQDILYLLLCYGGLVFSEIENPISTFFDALNTNKIKVIGAIKNGTLVGFVALYNFQKISNDKFSCYIYGIAKRKLSKEIELSIKSILESLKQQGCISVYCETRKYNLPMRNLANRMGFKKVGILHKASYYNSQFYDNILYEKILHE